MKTSEPDLLFSDITENNSADSNETKEEKKTMGSCDEILHILRMHEIPDGRKTDLSLILVKLPRKEKNMSSNLLRWGT